MKSKTQFLSLQVLSKILASWRIISFMVKVGPLYTTFKCTGLKRSFTPFFSVILYFQLFCTILGEERGCFWNYLIGLFFYTSAWTQLLSSIVRWLVHGQDLLVRLLINEQNPHVAEI